MFAGLCISVCVEYAISQPLSQRLRVCMLRLRSAALFLVILTCVVVAVFSVFSVLLYLLLLLLFLFLFLLSLLTFNACLVHFHCFRLWLLIFKPTHVCIFGTALTAGT